MTSSLAFYITVLRKDFTGYCNDRLQELGLSQGFLFFILYVGKHPGCSPKELAHGLHMDSGHVTRSLARLEQAEFLCQEINPEDRRARILRLKEKGEEAFRVSHELFSDWDKQVMEGMAEEDRARLLSLLDTLVREREGESCVRKSVETD